MKQKFPFPYIFKFLFFFCLFYYGTQAIVGFSAPGGRYHSFFIAKYFNYVAALRSLLLNNSKLVLELFGYDVYLKDAFTLRLKSGIGVHVVYSCIGYGVMIFWLAFILANQLSVKRKIKWMVGGLLMIWIINVVRISLMLVAVNEQWKSPFNFDNHTWFNIVAYIAIFTMMYFFDAAQKTVSAKTGNGQ